MPIDALLFDKDGTLFNFADTWEAFGRAFLLKISGNDAGRAAFLGQMMGFDFLRSRYERDSVLIAGTPREIAEVLKPELPEMSLPEIEDLINREAAVAPQAEAVPLRPFLDGLRADGKVLGVATNDAEEPALAHLDAAGIRECFDFIAGFDSGHGAKPGPGQLLAFAAHVGIAPDRIAMVGDSTHDLIAGRAAGMATVAVLTGMAAAEVLAPHADVVLPDIGHIPNWLAG